MSEKPGKEAVSRWIGDLRAGDQSAVRQLWNHFYARVVALARRKLGMAPRRVVDEEDIALSALDTCFRRARQGQLPRLNDRNDLWSLLAKITERKAYAHLRSRMRQKRGAGQIRGDSAIVEMGSSGGPGGMDRLAGSSPTPPSAVIMAENLESLLNRLADDELRQIALMKLQGYTNQEIAVKSGWSPPTIERRLRLIRCQWEEDSDEQRPSRRGGRPAACR